MAATEIEFEVLIGADEDLKLKTPKIAGVDHKLAEEFVAYLEEQLGQPSKRSRRKDKVGSSHHHEGEHHQH